MTGGRYAQRGRAAFGRAAYAKDIQASLLPTMSHCTKSALFALRLGLGWLFFYAGITKVINPDWSAAGYLQNAQTFSEFFAWFARPEILPVTNFLNEWGLTLLGVSLILGIGVRLSSSLGIVLMLLYYFPVLNFPHIGEHSFIVDDHIIFALALSVLAAFNAGRAWGLDRLFSRERIDGFYTRWIG